MRTFRSKGLLLTVFITVFCLRSSNADPILPDGTPDLGNGAHGAAPTDTEKRTSASEIAKVQGELVYAAVSKIGDCGKEGVGTRDKTLIYNLKEPLFAALVSYIETSKKEGATLEQPLGEGALRDMIAARYGYESYSKLKKEDEKLSVAVGKLAKFYGKAFSLVHDKLKNNTLDRKEDSNCKSNKAVIMNAPTGDARSANKTILCEYNLLNEIDGKDKANVVALQDAEDTFLDWMKTCSNRKLGDEAAVTKVAEEKAAKRSAKNNARDLVSEDVNKLEGDALKKHQTDLLAAQKELDEKFPNATGKNAELKEKVKKQLADVNAKLGGSSTLAQATTPTTSGDATKAEEMSEGAAEALDKLEKYRKGRIELVNRQTYATVAEKVEALQKIEEEHLIELGKLSGTDAFKDPKDKSALQALISEKKTLLTQAKAKAKEASKNDQDTLVDRIMSFATPSSSLHSLLGWKDDMTQEEKQKDLNELLSGVDSKGRPLVDSRAQKSQILKEALTRPLGTDPNYIKKSVAEDVEAARSLLPSDYPSDQQQKDNIHQRNKALQMLDSEIAKRESRIKDLLQSGTETAYDYANGQFATLNNEIASLKRLRDVQLGKAKAEVKQVEEIKTPITRLTKLNAKYPGLVSVENVGAGSGPILSDVLSSYNHVPDVEAHRLRQALPHYSSQKKNIQGFLKAVDLSESFMTEFRDYTNNNSNARFKGIAEALKTNNVITGTESDTELMTKIFPLIQKNDPAVKDLLRYLSLKKK